MKKRTETARLVVDALEVLEQEVDDEEDEDEGAERGRDGGGDAEAQRDVRAVPHERLQDLKLVVKHRVEEAHAEHPRDGRREQRPRAQQRQRHVQVQRTVVQHACMTGLS